MKKKQRKRYVWHASWHELILFTKQIYTKRLIVYSYNRWVILKEWLIIKSKN